MAETARQLQTIENGIVNRLDLTGAEFMDQAKRDLNIDRSAFPAVRKGKKGDTPRGPGEYLDDTTNLRNSIGYYVLQNGAIIRGRVEGPAEATSAATDTAGAWVSASPASAAPTASPACP